MNILPKKLTKAILKAGIISALYLASGTAFSAPLNITNDPLFISDSVAPGIFVMMDDSGSMDWEVLTVPFYDYEDYYEDGSTLRTNGLFLGYTSGDACNTGWQWFYYMYSNSDDLYNVCKISSNNSAYERDWRIKSSAFNVMYYDPDEIYSPWVAKNDDSSNGSAVLYPDADFNAVRSNPKSGETGYTSITDLEGFVWEVANVNSFGYCGNSPDGPEADYDYNRCSSDADCGAGGTCTLSRVDLWDNHTQYQVNGSVIDVVQISYPNFPVAGECPSANDPTASRINNCFGRVIETSQITDATEVARIKQNIANWYQYNRKRSLVAKTAVASILESAPFYRFGMGTLHDEFFTPLPASSVTDYIPHNQDLFNKFVEWNWQAQGTPLRNGLKQAGQYFQGLRSGYTGSDKPIVHKCQQNFSILFTDGYYNGSVSGFGDEDSDGTTASLADIAYYYYKTDLDTLFANDVPTTTFDTQDQQHMVTFSVAFGVSGNLVDLDNDGWPNPLPNHSDSKWYSGSSIDTNSERIDDMWHAAYDSRGAFISAKTPGDVVRGLNTALSAIQDRVGSASSAAASTGASVLTETNVFFAYFDSNDWSGDLLAYDISTDSASQVSSFENSIQASVNFYANARSNFFSWDPAANSAINFDWASLNSTQKAYLNDNPDTVNIDDDTFGTERLAFIKGDTSNDGEDVDGSSNVVLFRNRQGKTFGDVLNSAPQFVGGTFDKYGNPLAYINEDFSESSSFASFQTANKDRTHMIYVGANDGMLHGLIVDSDPSTTLANTSDPATIQTLGYLENYGKEAFAYIPSAMIKRLNKLTSSEYLKKGIATHRYYVDGTPTVADAYVNDNWKTVLVSGLGAGGQGVFALDITDGATTSNKDIVLWEFNDSDDADLGYTYSQPVIARLNDGQWYAIFGNGYNNTEANNMDAIPDNNVSTSGHAVLYVVKLSGPTGANNSWVLGTDYYKLDTGYGDTTTPNGLSTVSTLDQNRDQIVDAVYGGDLQGNIWRFDLLDGDTNINSGSFPSATSAGATTPGTDFRIAYHDINNNPMPMFTTDSGQPITSPLVIASHPIDGFLVILGTGKYVESGDNQTTGQPTQSFYGIWDSCVSGHRVGNEGEYQINYHGTNIPSSAERCEKVTRSDLLEQEIVKEEVETFTENVDSNNDGVIDSNDTPTVKNTEEVRITTRYRLNDYDKNDPPTNTQDTASTEDQFGNTVDYFTYTSETGWLNNAKDALAHQGWYLDLTFNGNNKSERNTNRPILLGGVIYFNTYTPSSASSCGAAGDTWIYSLSAADGSQLSTSAFDLNGDGSIDTQDEFNQAEVISARKRSGYTPGGTIITADSKKHSITFGGDIDGENDIDDAFYRVREGRQNWRLIR